MMRIFQDYLGQPDELPAEAAGALARLLPGEPILLYAFADLDHAGRYAGSWVALTARNIVILRPGPDRVAWSATPISIQSVENIDITDGLAGSWMSMVGADGKLHASIRYSRRQGRSMGSLKYAAEQIIKKAAEDAAFRDSAGKMDATEGYRKDVLKDIEDAKAALVMPKIGVLLRLLGYMRRHKPVVIAGLTLTAILTLLRLVPPYLTRVLVDDILRPLESGKGTGDPMAKLWIVIGILFGLLVSTEVLQFFRFRIMAIMGEKVAMQLRDDLYRHMQKLSLSFFGSRSTGSLITRVSSDTDRLWDFITFGFIDMAMAVLQIVGVAVALLLQNWSLALFVLLPVPVMGAMFVRHGRKMQVLFQRIWRKWSAMTAVLSDVIPGIRVVKAFAQEDRETERFGEKNRAVEQEAEILHREWTRFWPSVVMLMHTCTLIVWIIGAPRVIRYAQTGGAEGMPLGVFLAFIGYMWMFWEPVQQLGLMSRTINKVTTSASRVFEVLDTVPAIRSKPAAVTPAAIRGRVEYDNVTFSYDGIRNVLKGVSFDVRPGEMIGLVGPSGAGKSTLVNMICRFYDVKDGAVRIDGTDVRDMDVTALRRQIGVVLQEPYLFHGTISENIAYGSVSASVGDIIRAAKAANAHDFICGFPDGYETLVGERGQTLSGGERQRISIARAILHDPRILILDEATSSVDTETEKKIQEALRRLVTGRTTFAIAHRLSTLNSADRLFVFEKGKLVEHGTHGELLAKPDGIYAKLHRTQVEMHANIAV